MLRHCGLPRFASFPSRVYAFCPARLYTQSRPFKMPGIHSISSNPGSDGKAQDLARETVDVNERGLTTDFGTRIADTDHWLKLSGPGQTGPHLLEDQVAREKIQRFDHERIPERVVHARGTGAFGTFKLHKSAEEFTTANVLTDITRETPVFVRFSTVQGSKGSADTVRDVRGFAVKFYTQEGIWDLVGNNIPIFFIQEAIKFPDFVHAVKPEPHNEIPQAQTAHNNFWDFVTLHTEATHMMMWAMSDRTIPRSYRMMQGFGVNTYVFVNAQQERFLVKFHFVPELGVHSLQWDEALKLAGQDPDFHRKDLMDAIDNKAFPRWKFGFQVIPESSQDQFDFDPLDATKIWPEERVPVNFIGTLELNRNVDEFFTQTEQAAFCTSHIVPGIDFSNDPLLQGRNFSYFDTQISRLGANWEELPINRPVCPVLNFNRDGQSRHRITRGTVNYWPNRFEACPPHGRAAPEGPSSSNKISQQSSKVRALGPKFREHFQQARLFYNSLTQSEKTHLISAFSFELSHCDDSLVHKQLIGRLSDINLELAQAVSVNIGCGPVEKKPLPDAGESPALSQIQLNNIHRPAKPTIAGRKIAIFGTDGYNPASLQYFIKAIKAFQGVPLVVGLTNSPISACGEDSHAPGGLKPDTNFAAAKSTLFDALLVPDGKYILDLAEKGAAKHWILETYGHLKPIGAVGSGAKLVQTVLEVVPEITSKLKSPQATQVGHEYGIVQSARPDQVANAAIPEPSTWTPNATDFMSLFLYYLSEHRVFAREPLLEQVAY